MILSCKNYWPILVLLSFLVSFQFPVWGQNADDILLYRPRGTGRTTGHIITLTVHNPSSNALPVRIAPCLIPAAGRYQGYVIHKAHEALVPPQSRVEIALNGYCTNVFKPALPDGATGTPYKQWVDRSKSLPAPTPGGTVPQGFTTQDQLPPDSMQLTYPGTLVPFPYQVDFDRHPAAAADLLIQIVNLLEGTVTELAPALSLPGGQDNVQMQELVQQVFWQYTARLSGGYYPLPYFRHRLEEQVALATGQTPASFSEQTQEEITDAGFDLWSTFHLVGAEAKVIAKPSQTTDESEHYGQWIRSSVDGLNPANPDALSKWLELRDTLAAIDRYLDGQTAEYAGRQMATSFPSVLQTAIRRLSLQSASFPEEWRSLQNLTAESFFTEYLDKEQQTAVRDNLQSLMESYLEPQSARLDPQSPDFFEQLDALQSLLARPEMQNVLSESVRQQIDQTLSRKVRAFVDEALRRLETNQTDRLKNWLDLIHLAQTDWFRNYLDENDYDRVEARLKDMLETELRNQVDQLDPSDEQMIAKWMDLIYLRQIDFIGDYSEDIREELREKLVEKLAAHLQRRVDQLDPADPKMFQQWLDLVFLMQTDFIYDYLEIWGKANTIQEAQRQKLRTFFDRQTTNLNETAPDFMERWAALETALSDDWTPNFLTPEETKAIRDRLAEIFTAKLQRDAEALNPPTAGFIQQWRVLDQGTKTEWFDKYVPEATKDALSQVLEKKYRKWYYAGRKVSVNPDIDWKRVRSAQPSFKIPVAVPNAPLPTWIPIAGGAALTGGIIWATVGGDEPPPPEPPVAVDDAVTVNCNSEATVNVLANDRGDGLFISAINAPASVSIQNAGGGTLIISGFGAGSFSFTYTITDENGNSDSATVTVTVTDDAPPEITCPPNITVSCAADLAPEALGQAQAVDNCDENPNITSADQLNEGACSRPLVRTWRATDQSGLSATCEQVITLIDDQAPAIECPPDITISTEDPRDPENTGSANANDDCGPLAGTFTLSFEDNTSGLNDAGAGPLLRTWTARDACGNSQACEQTITLQVPIKLEITCPPDIAVNCEEGVDPTLTGQALLEGNCPDGIDLAYADEITEGDCAGAAIIDRTWTGTDACGKVAECRQTIQRTDEQAPEMQCPPNVAINLDGDISPNNTGSAEATDNCTPSEDILLDFEDSFSGLTECAGTGVILRTWTADDRCGNTSSCDQEIRLQDNQPPVIACPLPATAGDLNEISPEQTGQATATDNASTIANIAIAYEDDRSGLDGCGGILQRNWIATDECGNVSVCTQDIIILDQEPPQLTCPPAVEVTCENIQNTDVTGLPTVTDNYSEDSALAINFIDRDDDLPPCGGGDFVRIWTATDACENTSSCEQLISVLPDMQAPELRCPQEVKVSCGQETDLTITGVAEAKDNCSAEVTLDYSDDFSGLGSDCEGTVVRTWTASDLCGNTVSCTQNILVSPTEIVDDAPQGLAFGLAPVNILPSTVDFTRSHQNSYDPARTLELLQHRLPEHPRLDPVPDFRYYSGPVQQVTFFYQLNPQNQLRADLQRIDAIGLSQWTFPNSAPATLQSSFQGTTAGVVFEHQFTQGLIRPTLGLRGQWHHLSVDRSVLRLDDKWQVLPDDYHISNWDIGLTGGLQFSPSPRVTLQLNGQWYPFGAAGRRFGIWQGVIVR